MKKKNNGNNKKGLQKRGGDLAARFERWFQPKLWNGNPFEGWPWPMGLEEGPAVDVVDKGDALQVTAELPGMNKDDFEIAIEGGRLVLRGEKKSEREEKKENYYYCERTYGSFSRSIALPCEIQADKVKADYDKGVLSIQLPKAESAKPKRVKENIA